MTSYAVMYLGEVVDVYDTDEQAREGRRQIVRDIKAGRCPGFLDADDIDGVEDFYIQRGDWS